MVIRFEEGTDDRQDNNGETGDDDAISSTLLALVLCLQSISSSTVDSGR